MKCGATVDDCTRAVAGPVKSTCTLPGTLRALLYPLVFGERLDERDRLVSNNRRPFRVAAPDCLSWVPRHEDKDGYRPDSERLAPKERCRIYSTRVAADVGGGR